MNSIIFQKRIRKDKKGDKTNTFYRKENPEEKVHVHYVDDAHSIAVPVLSNKKQKEKIVYNRWRTETQNIKYAQNIKYGWNKVTQPGSCTWKVKVHRSTIHDSAQSETWQAYPHFFSYFLAEVKQVWINVLEFQTTSTYYSQIEGWEIFH